MFGYGGQTPVARELLRMPDSSQPCRRWLNATRLVCLGVSPTDALQM